MPHHAWTLVAHITIIVTTTPKHAYHVLGNPVLQRSMPPWPVYHERHPIDTAEIRDHTVFTVMVTCRPYWALHICLSGCPCARFSHHRAILHHLNGRADGPSHDEVDVSTGVTLNWRTQHFRRRLLSKRSWQRKSLKSAPSERKMPPFKRSWRRETRHIPSEGVNKG